MELTEMMFTLPLSPPYLTKNIVLRVIVTVLVDKIKFSLAIDHPAEFSSR
jgi:hypothetical protein